MRARLLLLLLAATALPAAGADTPAVDPTPEATRAEFARICRELTEGDNIYFGAGGLPRLEQDVRGTVGPVNSAKAQANLGIALMRLGRVEEAIEKLEDALGRIEALAERREGRGPAAEIRTVRLRIVLFLALAHLQAGEEANCVERHAEGSCILPIRPEAIHTLPDHARRAGELLAAYVAEAPQEIQPAWLLNIARMTSGEWPEGIRPDRRLPEPLAPRDADPATTWRDLAPELGVDAFDLSGGALLDDFDGDGLLDLVSSSWDPCEPMKAFRNDGRGGFEDVSAAWGLDAQLGGLNMMHADYDGDGHLDILVLRGGWMGTDGRIRNSLLRNELAGEAGRFVDVTARAGLAEPAYPTQTAAWGDYDGDGDLDLYVGNESGSGAADPAQPVGPAGGVHPSQLFRNAGDGTFEEVADEAGVESHLFTKAVVWGDYDDDGDPDLYVSTLSRNRLYRNDGDGTFTDVAAEAGVLQPLRGSFPTWFFDFDHDGDLDIFVGAYYAKPTWVSASYFGMRVQDGRPYLYRNDGDGTFTDVAVEAGLGRPLLPMGSNYGDLDNDGWLDLYLGTGTPAFEALMPNVAYRNDRAGGFVDVTFESGLGHLQKGHGVAFGDVDNDGEQEIFQQMGGAFPYDRYGNALYDNPDTGGNAWLTLRFAGAGANRFAVGARVELVVASGEERRSFHHLVGSGGSFGGSSLQLEVGLGRAQRVERIVVRWPGGPREIFPGAEPGRFYLVRQGSGELEPLDVPAFELAGEASAPPATHHHAGSSSP